MDESLFNKPLYYGQSYCRNISQNRVNIFFQINLPIVDNKSEKNTIHEILNYFEQLKSLYVHFLIRNRIVTNHFMDFTFL